MSQIVPMDQDESTPAIGTVQNVSSDAAKTNKTPSNESSQEEAVAGKDTDKGQTPTIPNAPTASEKPATPATPDVSEAPKEDPNKYLKDANGKVITGAGWHKLGDKWYYTNNVGELFKDLKDINGSKYYLDPTNGVMRYSWQTISNNKYYFGGANDGAMKKGWQKIGAAWYYLDPNTGILKDSWQTINGKTYYLGDKNDGAMRSGWQNVSKNGKTSRYYFGGTDDGSMKTGWQKLGHWYYFEPGTGISMTGWQKINGRTYYLGGTNDGAMRSGWTKAPRDGKTSWFYLGGADDGSMKTGWQKLGAWYYLEPSNGAMATALKKVGNKTYYFGGADDGSMKSGWQKITKDGKTDWYLFGGPSDGAMKTGWQKLGAWYYLDPATGAMKTGWQKIGAWYYLGGANDGSMKSGWQQLAKAGADDKTKYWYHFGGANDGSRKSGWLSSGRWYYLDPQNDDIMVANTNKTIDKKLYSFESSGAMRANAQVRLENDTCGYAAPSGEISKIGVFKGKDIILKPDDTILKGWQKLAGAWFYANNDGIVQTGWLREGGTWYYLQPSSGAMATGSCKVGSEMNYFEGNGAWNSEKTNMVKRAQGFSSPTSYLILVDVNACRVGVFSGSRGSWNLIRYEPCVCGAPGTPTIRGTYATGYHLGNLPAWSNALYCTNITGGYFFHSILSSTSELGGHLSHGCVRLNWPFAQYIQSLPYSNTVNLY